MKVILEAKKLKKSFVDNESIYSVLDEIDFSVQKGESISIQGQSGSGKTTLLYTLSLLEKKDSGGIFWDGEDMNNVQPGDVFKKRGLLIGMVFQSYFLIDELNVLENVVMGMRILNKIDSSIYNKAYKLLDKVGIANKALQLPCRLSGGEKQRVALVRALLPDPKIILADEPTGNLDPSSGKEVMDLLISMCGQYSTSLVLVTHNTEHAKRLNKHFFLENGKLKEIQYT